MMMTPVGRTTDDDTFDPWQDATGKIQQQCSDFIMTRNIQCREMIEDVQRKLAGFNLSSSSHNTNTLRSSSVPPDQHSPPPSHAPHAQSSYGAPPGGDPRPVYSQPESRPPYSQPYPTYGAPPQQPPYGAAHPGQYQQHPQQHQPPPGHDYGQPAYPGWRGPYYNGQQPQPQPRSQQPGPYPQAPYSAPGAYPPHHQSNYYRPQ
ncbi:unnamed protein product [Triticum turgidum subsp. durum]|uniref:Uncharacterized protein n=1 Tax=Triticum turgidum subsp. durum TaxID=4567 RepID=A0A9R0Q7D9_TRITD|nr:unnamed protein product [Triticum turgidum subsp. durum]